MKTYVTRAICSLTLLLLLTNQPVDAQEVKISAVGAQSYADKVTAAIKDKALEKAKLAAFKKYMAKQPKARKSVYRPPPTNRDKNRNNHPGRRAKRAAAST